MGKCSGIDLSNPVGESSLLTVLTVLKRSTEAGGGKTMGIDVLPFPVAEGMSASPPKAFQHEKTQCLSGVDWSRKGSIDAPIESLVRYVNQLPQYFTTSSCSGRVCVYEQNTESQKQGCRWLLTSHSTVETEQVLSASEESDGDAFFKFEAFVMHVQCWRLEDAQTMHSVAVASGFRNSGITVGRKGKIIVAIRSTHGLEAPITLAGKLLVDEQYIRHLTTLANNKMEENVSRINRFFTNLKTAIESQKEVTAKKQKTTKDQRDKTSAPTSAKIAQQKNHQIDDELNDEQIVEDCAFMFDET